MSRQLYRRLHSLLFRADWPGYKPDVVEAPNGDGRKDETKKYAHLARKYLDQANPWAVDDLHTLSYVFELACKEAAIVAKKLGVPQALMPDPRYSALRILDYPPGAGSAEHKDMDLFTMHLYRDPNPGGFRRTLCLDDQFRLDEACPGLHLGEMAEVARIGPATPHKVLAMDEPQHSIVYFAIPDHAAELKPGLTVGEWLAERMSRSRFPR